MTSNSFIKIWLFIFIICMLLVALINIFVDPYNLWGTQRIESISQLKPASVTRSRLVKPHQLSRFNANTLILGNSRPEMGLNPDSTCWPDNFKPIYNQAIPGVHLYQQFRLLQHAIHFKKPKNIIIAVDFNDFISDKPIHEIIWPPKHDITALSVYLNGDNNQQYPLSVLLDHLKVTFSLSALSDSFFTIMSQHDKFSSNLTPAGFNTAYDYNKIIATEGQSVLFLQKNREMLKRMNRPMYLMNDQAWSQSFETYEQLLNFAKQKKINVTVFINAYHSDYLEVIKQTGLWNLFLQWKAKIAKITLDFNDVSLWDFALVNQYTIESPPKNGIKNSKIEWFWEPAHYNKNYGNLMLSQMYKTTCSNMNIGLQVENIDKYNKQLKTQKLLLQSSESAERISVLLENKNF